MKKEFYRTFAGVTVFTSANPQKPLISIEFAIKPNLNQIADENQLQPWQQTAVTLLLDQNILLALQHTIQTGAHDFKANNDGKYEDLYKPNRDRKFADCKITFNDQTITVNYTINDYYHTHDNLGFSLTCDIKLQLKPTEVLLPNHAGNTINIADITESTYNFLDLFEITDAELNSVYSTKNQHDVQKSKDFVFRDIKDNLKKKDYSALDNQLAIFNYLDKFDKDQIIIKVCSDDDVLNLERVIQLTTLIDSQEVTPADYPNLITFKEFFEQRPLYKELQPLITVKNLLTSSELNSTKIRGALNSYSANQLAQLIDSLNEDELNKLAALVTAQNPLTYSAEHLPLTTSMLKTKQQLQENPALLDALHRDSPSLFYSRLESLASTTNWGNSTAQDFVNNTSREIFNLTLTYVIKNLSTIEPGFWQLCFSSLLTGANKNAGLMKIEQATLTQNFVTALNNINSIDITAFIKGCDYQTFTKLIEFMDNSTTTELSRLSDLLMRAPRYLSYYLGHRSPQKFDLLKINSILSTVTQLPDGVQNGFIAQLDEHAVSKLAELNNDPQSLLPPEFSGFWDKVKNSASYSKFALNVLSLNPAAGSNDLITQLSTNLAALSGNFWEGLNFLQKATIMRLQEENKFTNSELAGICNTDKKFNTSYKEFKLLYPIISAPACAAAIQQDPILFYCCIQKLYNVKDYLQHIFAIATKFPDILQELRACKTVDEQKERLKGKLGEESSEYTEYVAKTMDGFVAPLAALTQLQECELTNDQIQSLAQGLYPTAQQCLDNLVRLNYPQYIAKAEASLSSEILADTDKRNMLKETNILATYEIDLTRPQFQQLIIIDQNGSPVINLTNIDINNSVNLERFEKQLNASIDPVEATDKIRFKLFTLQTLQTIIEAKIRAILDITIRQLSGVSRLGSYSVETELNLKTLYVDISARKIYLQTMISVTSTANNQCLTDYAADYSADFILNDFTEPALGVDIHASEVITIKEINRLTAEESQQLASTIKDHLLNATDMNQEEVNQGPDQPAS